MPKVQIVGAGQYVITIPVHLIRALQIKKGDEFLVQLNKDGNMEFIKSQHGPVCEDIPGGPSK